MKTHVLSCRCCKCLLTVSIGGICRCSQSQKNLFPSGEKSRRKVVSSKLSGAVNVQCSVLFHQQVFNSDFWAHFGPYWSDIRSETCINLEDLWSRYMRHQEKKGAISIFLPCGENVSASLRWVSACNQRPSSLYFASTTVGGISTSMHQTCDS